MSTVLVTMNENIKIVNIYIHIDKVLPREPIHEL
jgi:hypothetical protein